MKNYHLIIILLVLTFNSFGQISNSFNYDSIYNTGIEYYNNGEKQSAENLFQEIITEFRRDEVLFGKKLYLGGSLSEEEMDRFVEKVAYYEYSSLYLGMIYLHSGEPHEALNYFFASIKTDSTNSFANIGIADCYKEIYQLPTAFDYYSIAIKTDPENSYTYGRRSEVLADLKQYDLAIEDLTKAIALEPECVNCLVSRGYYYLKNGNYEESISDFNSVLNIMPNEPYSLNNKGMALFKLGNSQEGISLIEKSLKFDFNNAYAFKNLAIIYSEQGDMERACNEAKKAIKNGIEVEFDPELGKILETCQ